MEKTAADLRTARWTGLGGVAAAAGAALGWICCLPLFAGAAGVAAATAGAASWLAPLRPWLGGAALLLLAFAFYHAYRREDCPDGAVCAAPRRRRRTRLLLWIAAVAVLLLLTLPRWSSWLIYWSL